jgi:hypothetical protein
MSAGLKLRSQETYMALASTSANILPQSLDVVGDNAHDRKGFTSMDIDRGIVGVGGFKHDHVAHVTDALDTMTPIVEDDDNFALTRRSGTVDHQYITGFDPVPTHAVARNAHKIGRFGMGDAEVIEIQSALNVVLGRGGKTALYHRGKEGNQVPGGDASLDNTARLQLIKGVNHNGSQRNIRYDIILLYIIQITHMDLYLWGPPLVVQGRFATRNQKRPGLTGWVFFIQLIDLLYGHDNQPETIPL